MNKKLSEILKRYDKLAVALSGGAASACLLREAASVLGPNNILALTADCELLARRELNMAKRIAMLAGVEHHVVPVDVMSIASVRSNGQERCMLCKQSLFGALLQEAWTYGIHTIAAGGCPDGCAAGLEEIGIIHPFVEAGMDIRDVCALSDGLSGAAMHPCACLAARFSAGMTLTLEMLEKVDAAENALYRMGLLGIEVRLNGGKASLQIPPDQMEACARNAKAIAEALEQSGLVATQNDE